MATLILANTFTALTNAESSEVNENFNDIVTFINTEVAHLDGSLAFTGVPSGPDEDPASANQLARKAYVDARSADAENITTGTLVVPRGGTGKSSVTAGNYLKGAGTDAMVEVTPKALVQEGLGIVTPSGSTNRRISFGTGTLTWAGGSSSIAHTMDFTGINVIVCTPNSLFGEFSVSVVSYAANQVTVQGHRIGGYTGTAGFSYIAIHQDT